VSSKTVTETIQAIAPASNTPFAITKIGHVVLNCRDLERSVKFYTQILGFKISDIYEPEMVPGGMVFMRFNADHHGVGLVGAMTGSAENIELHHLAFEVDSVDDRPLCVIKAKCTIVATGMRRRKKPRRYPRVPGQVILRRSLWHGDDA
jgi:catechol 2,3-dioxygenase-like lactoylglutathione lyase family enzyme